MNIGAGASSNIFTPFGGGQRLCPIFLRHSVEGRGCVLVWSSHVLKSRFLHHLSTTYRWVAGEKDDIICFPTVRMKRELPHHHSPLTPMNSVHATVIWFQPIIINPSIALICLS